MRADTAMFWHIWVSLQTLILRPAAIVERASLLTNGIRYLFLRFIDGIIIALGSFDCPLGQRVIS